MINKIINKGDTGNVSSYAGHLIDQHNKLKGEVEEGLHTLEERINTGELDDLRLLSYLTYKDRVDELFREIYNQYMDSSAEYRSLILNRLYDIEKRQDKLAKSINYLGVVIILLCMIAIVFFFKLKGV